MVFGGYFLAVVLVLASVLIVILAVVLIVILVVLILLILILIVIHCDILHYICNGLPATIV